MLLTITTQMRRYKFRPLPEKYLGDFKYASLDSSEVTRMGTNPNLYPWIAKKCGREAGSVACVPDEANAAVGGGDPTEWNVDTSCGTMCTNFDY